MFPVEGILTGRRYTCKRTSLLVLVHICEGAVQSNSDSGISAVICAGRNGAEMRAFPTGRRYRPAEQTPTFKQPRTRSDLRINPVRSTMQLIKGVEIRLCRSNDDIGIGAHAVHDLAFARKTHGHLTLGVRSGGDVID